MMVSHPASWEKCVFVISITIFVNIECNKIAVLESLKAKLILKKHYGHWNLGY